jgi:hypothetical protein
MARTSGQPATLRAGLSAGGDSIAKEFQSVEPVLSQTATVVVSDRTRLDQPSTSLSSLTNAQSGKELAGARKENSARTTTSSPSASTKGLKSRRFSLFKWQADSKSSITGDCGTAGESSSTAEQNKPLGSWRTNISRTGIIIRRSKPVLLAKKSKQSLADFFKKESGQATAEGDGVNKPEEV